MIKKQPGKFGIDRTNSESPIKSQDSGKGKAFDINLTKLKTKENRQEQTIATFKNVAQEMVLNSDTKLAPMSLIEEMENQEAAQP